MNLQDVSYDSSMIGWLRQAGHGHLLEQQQHQQYANYSQASPRSSPLPPPPPPSPPLIAAGGHTHIDSYRDSYNHSASYSGVGNVHTQGYYPPPSPVHVASSSAQFIAPHMNQPYDPDVDHLRRDPNTQVIHRPPPDDVVYRQRVFMRYLQPPTPPVSGAIIVREKQLPQPPPDPPLVIKRAPPPPPTPPPVVIRERPPPIPPPEPTTIINKFVPALPKPPRQVIIEQYPQLPPKPRDVIVERWLPQPPRQRRILYERLPAPVMPPPPRPIIVQHGQPQVRVHREVTTQHGVQLPYQQMHSTIAAAPSSSLVSYSPHSAIQPAYGSIAYPQSNVVVMQNELPNVVSSSSYGLPLSYISAPNTISGLGGYGCVTSCVPTVGYTPGSSAVYSVPENVPVDNILRQLGVDPCSLHPSSSGIMHSPAGIIHSPSGIIHSPSNIIAYPTSFC